MPAAKATVPAGSAAPASRLRTRGAGLVASAASSMAGAVGTTVLTVACLSGIGMWERRKAMNPQGGPAALCGLDLGPPIGGPRDASVVPRTVDPPVDPASLSSSGPPRHHVPGAPVPAFLRTVAVPWGGAAVVLVVGVVEFLLDGRGAG